MPAFGGPSALSVAKKAQKTAKKALTASKKKVGSKRLARGAVTSSKLAKRAVTNSKLSDGSVSTAKLVDGSVTAAKLADASVGTAKIIDESVTAQDLAGTDATGTMTIGVIAASICTTFPVSVPGAAVGDVVLSSFVGGTPSPQGLVIQPLNVPSPGSVNYRACNPTNTSSTAVTGSGSG